MTASLHPVSGTAEEVLPLLRGWLDTGEPLTMRTSGSTGAPKDVVLSRDAMVASATAAIDRLGGPGQWLLPLPVTGVGGLQVLLRSILAGTDPVVDADVVAGAERLTAERRYASIVPTQLHRLDAAGRLDVLARLDAVLIGGAGTDPDLLARARAAGVEVVRTYGMTETCGGCVYDGLPLDGVAMRVVDEQVELSGPVLMDGYTDPVLTADAVQDGWFRTGDLGRITDGVLSITGRRDDVVQSGAVKVALPAVTAALKSLEGVRDAIALGAPDPEWGSRVVAFVVPGDAVCLDALRLDELRDAVEEAGLPRASAPRQVVLVDDLPLLANGKIDRQALLRYAG